MAAKPLKPPAIDCGDVQGIILRGYGRLPEARYLLLRFGHADPARDWLASLVPRLTSARAVPEETAVNVGFTACGLAALGLPEEARAGFASAFVDGISDGCPDGRSHRSRILGDVPPVEPATWRWGKPGDAIDAILLLFASDSTGMKASLAEHVRALEDAGIASRTLEARELHGRKEHFGFRDGISQPAIRNANALDDQPGVLAPDRPENTVEAGEFLLGYRDAYGQRSEGPLVDPALDPGGILALLDADEAPFPHWGHNGSYLVVRQLQQDVQRFWQVVWDAATRAEVDPRWLAARIVGRWPSGAPLVLAPEADDPELENRNDFGFRVRDPEARLCPAGSHVRRANPRDWTLSPTSEHSLTVANRHRLIRRGRPYGDPVDRLLDPEKMLAAERDDGLRGLQFLCFNANLERQYEMVQRTWLDNPKFAGLRDEQDPVLGGGGRFSVPGSAVPRRIDGLPRFVQTVGAGYFFVPGLRALRWLAGARLTPSRSACPTPPHASA